MEVTDTVVSDTAEVVVLPVDEDAERSGKQEHLQRYLQVNAVEFSKKITFCLSYDWHNFNFCQYLEKFVCPTYLKLTRSQNIQPVK